MQFSALRNNQASPFQNRFTQLNTLFAMGQKATHPKQYVSSDSQINQLSNYCVKIDIRSKALL